MTNPSGDFVRPHLFPTGGVGVNFTSFAFYSFIHQYRAELIPIGAPQVRSGVLLG